MDKIREDKRGADAHEPRAEHAVRQHQRGHDHEHADVTVVDANPEIQIARLMARDGVSEPDARAALSAQWSQEERRARADDIIENNGDLSELDRQVRALHQHYLSLAE